MLGAPLNLVLLQIAIQQQLEFVIHAQTDVRLFQLQGYILQLLIGRRGSGGRGLLLSGGLLGSGFLGVRRLSCHSLSRSGFCHGSRRHRCLLNVFHDHRALHGAHAAADGDHRLALGNRSDLAVLGNGGNRLVLAGIDNRVGGVLRAGFYMEQEHLPLFAELHGLAADDVQLLTGDAQIGGLADGGFRRLGGGHRGFSAHIRQEELDKDKARRHEQHRDEHRQHDHHQGVLGLGFLLVLFLVVIVAVVVGFLVFARFPVHFVKVKNLLGSLLAFRRFLQQILTHKLSRHVRGAAADGAALGGIRVGGAANVTNYLTHSDASGCEWSFVNTGRHYTTDFWELQQQKYCFFSTIPL